MSARTSTVEHTARSADRVRAAGAALGAFSATVAALAVYQPQDVASGPALADHLAQNSGRMFLAWILVTAARLCWLVMAGMLWSTVRAHRSRDHLGRGGGAVGGARGRRYRPYRDQPPPGAAVVVPLVNDGTSLGLLMATGEVAASARVVLVV